MMFRKLRMMFRMRRMEADLAEELDFHRSMTTAKEFGNTARAIEDARAVWLAPALESVFQDVRYGSRTLLAHGGFTCTAALALGIAIGLNTSLFTVFNAAAIRPWPVRDPGTVMNVFSMDSQQHAGGFSVAEARFLGEHARLSSGFLLNRQERVRVGEEGSAKTARAIVVSGNFFDVLGVRMQSGRGFLPEEDQVDSPQAVAVIPFQRWQNYYGSDPQIVGKPILVDGLAFTIVGVAAEEFTGTVPDGTDLWIPLASLRLLRPGDGIRDFLTDPHQCCSAMTVRIAPGATAAQARAELTALSNRYRPEQNLEKADILLTSTAFMDNPGRKSNFMPVLGLFFLGVFLVLALACANVGNLILARSAARTREIAVRLSLGASRARVVRQLITESLLLALLAGSLGLLLAAELPSMVLKHVVPGGMPGFHLGADRMVLGYALAISAVSCVLFGLAPALRVTRLHVGEHASLRLRNTFLAIQLALSVVLLVGAALLFRGVSAARNIDPKFQVRDISIASMEFPASAYAADRMPAFWSALRDAMRQSPALSRAAMTSNPPLSSSRMMTSFHQPGEAERRTTITMVQEASPEFFTLLKIPIVAGRNFTETEAPDSIIVSETFAQRYFPNQNAIGKSILSGKNRQIVGVARDAYLLGLDRMEPLLYLPFQARLGVAADSVVLTGASPSEREELVAAVSRIDKRVHVRFSSLNGNLERWLSGPQVAAALAAIFGVFALILASIGVFGVFAYHVEQRKKEIGIRMAVGAAPGRIVRGLLSASFRAVMIGLGAGFVGAAALSTLIRSYLFGAPLLDAYAYAGVALALAVAGLLATWIPARRATRIDPMTALRYE